METFGAKPGTPVEECTELAASADAIVVLVAHRYGWVPLTSEGGDGNCSITWLEVSAALRAHRPVFAFLISESANWPELREQDRLLEASDEESMLQIGIAVQRLQAFKRFLSANVVREKFESVDDLRAKVTGSLAPWLLKQAPANESTSSRRPERIWKVREVHPLQHAPHFRGRASINCDLLSWWSDPFAVDRVVSLVAAGGTGKTAIAENLLRSIKEVVPLRAGVFVWSFYENEMTEKFFRAACEYFGGISGDSAGGLLERLQATLDSDDEPHLMILDGLERVQAEAGSGHIRGDITDHQLRLLLRSVVSGLGRTRILATSRFELVDLRDWTGTGHRFIRLDDLDPDAARALLQAWGVKGDLSDLDSVAQRVGRHALSVSVLGSYLGNFCDGNPLRAAELDLEHASEDDPKAGKLRRVLAYYAAALLPKERDLLARLSAFPRGIGIEILGYLAGAGGVVAGNLHGAGATELLRLLNRLRDLGLVFRYGTEGKLVFTAHPFLRDTFKALLDIDSEHIHEAVRVRLAPGLSARPGTFPTAPAMLDRYENLIEQTRLSGRVSESFQLFQLSLGDWNHLGSALGEYSRGARILAGFSSSGLPDDVSTKLTREQRLQLLSSWSLFADAIGNVGLAERCIRLVIRIQRADQDSRDIAVSLQNLSDLQRLRGFVPQALESAKEALSLAKGSKQDLNAHCYLAVALLAAGRTSEARKHFELAGSGRMRKHAGLRGIWEAEFLFAVGDVEAALIQTKANLETCLRYHWNRSAARCQTLLGQIAILSDLAFAKRYLEQARSWCSQTGDIETIIRAHALASEIARYGGDLLGAVAEARNGLRVATDCGYRLYAIDLHVTLAKAYLEIPEAQAALAHATDAVNSSRLRECGYVWGEAEALHFQGIAHRRLGDLTSAKGCLQNAMALRWKIKHPRAEESGSEWETLR